MKKRNLSVLNVHEIETIRIVCQNCKSVAEIPVENVDRLMGVDFKRCLFCHKEHDWMNPPEQLKAFAKAVEMLKNIQNLVHFEIVSEEKN